MTNDPKYVASARRRLIEAGGRRLPTGCLQPAAADALAALQARRDWPDTAIGCISRAIIKAAGDENASQD